MSWGVDRATLEEGREEKLEEVARERSHHALEGLGRAHRWLDDLEAAVDCFREAAQDVERRIESRGRGDADSRGRIGSLLRLAGDHAASAQWFTRALEGTREDEVTHVAAYCYLLEDPESALAAVARAQERWPLEIVEALARARVEQAPELAVAAREHTVLSIRAERTPPYHESGSPHLSLFDWLEETFAVEALLRGEAVPDHATMLGRAELLSPEEGRMRRRRRPPDKPPPPGRATVARTTPDGAQVEATLEITDLGDISMVLDPREGIELSVLLLKQFGEFIVRIQSGEEGESEEDLDDTYEGFRAACAAAADWLRAYAPDPPGGAWAAETVDALVAAAPSW